MSGFIGSLGSTRDRKVLGLLQRRALSYFLENQGADGLVQDRQANHGPTRQEGPLSVSATGMGLIAVALASASPYRLISKAEAVDRVRAALQTGLDRLPSDHGIFPHFVEPGTLRSLGEDAFSTVDSSWFLAGALWASGFLSDPDLVEMATDCYNRVDWRYWSTGARGHAPWQIRHGKGPRGRFLPCSWDRANGETLMMYVLAAGALDDRAIPGEAWCSLGPFYGEVAGHRFNNADLGLFVFQYGLDLLDLARWRTLDGPDLRAEASVAALANRDACLASAHRFQTYRRHWGLSAGDGPGLPTGLDAYNDYSPTKDLDGTAHLTATLASVAHLPDAVLANVRPAMDHDRPSPLGRYGLSSVNDDRGWIARDMIGIDAGAAILALDNVLVEDRVRSAFHELPCVRKGMARLGFRDDSGVRRAS